MRPLRWPFVCSLSLSLSCASDTKDSRFDEPTVDAVEPLDASLTADATRPRDALVSLDAATPARDAAFLDSALRPVDATTFVCEGATPHGCFVAHTDNPQGCPAQIHEQSAGYPPLDEWTGCEAPWYQPCVYSHDGKDLTCVCDLGFHWVCDY